MKKDKQEQECDTVDFMVRYYCRKQHGSKQLCPTCEAVLAYANQQIKHCPFMETKTFCSACKVQCYNKDMQERIRIIMRYSGQRMIWHHPIIALKHVYVQRKEKRL